MVQHPKTFLLIGLLICSVAFFSKCMTDASFTNDARGSKYAGTKACATCHQSTFDSYTHNNHYKTSTPINNAALTEMMKNSAAFYFQDSSFVRVVSSSNAFYQNHFSHSGSQLRSNQFDIAFGSGEKAQTFASWQQDKLLQLPLTYLASTKSWMNSPGFPVTHARFDRVINSRCFECHASYIAKEMVQSGPVAVSEKLDRNTIVYGIDCERCHGPAAEHVQFQQANPTVKTAKFITSIRSLGRQQQLDVCAACHSGNDQSTQRSLFAFVPGDTLSHFYFPEFESNSKELDVHGKQMQLLQASLCFQKSNITCGTCHSAHETENNQMAFVSKCMTCHQSSLHANTLLKEMKAAPSGTNMKTNCITCHMPLQPSNTISFTNSSGINNSAYLLRTHKIAVYK